jgi:preprotein translocase subunit SecE
VSDSAPGAAEAGREAGAPRERTAARTHDAKKDVKPGLFARIAKFWRQVVAELKKVVYPTRSELVSWTTAVLVFVAIVMAFVTLVDVGIGKLMFWVFGG